MSDRKTANSTDNPFGWDAAQFRRALTAFARRGLRGGHAVLQSSPHEIAMPDTVRTRREREQWVLRMLDEHARRIHEGKGAIDLSQSDLRGLDLRGFDFRWTNLRGAQFQDAYIAEARFNGADLRDANFYGVLGRGADFTSAMMQNAKIRSADLINAMFESAVLLAASFAHTKLRHANFTRAQASCASFANADLECATFYQANLHAADLQDARMPGARVRHACLKLAAFPRADLQLADLSNTVLHGTSFFDEFSIPNVPDLLATLIQEFTADPSSFAPFDLWDHGAEHSVVDRVIALAGEQGERLSLEVGPSVAAALILYSSCGAVPNLQDPELLQALTALTRKTKFLYRGHFSLDEAAVLAGHNEPITLAPTPSSGSWACTTFWQASPDVEIRIVVGGFCSNAEADTFGQHTRLDRAHGRLVISSETHAAMVLADCNVTVHELRDDLFECLEERGTTRIEDSDYKVVPLLIQAFDQHPVLRWHHFDLSGHETSPNAALADSEVRT